MADRIVLIFSTSFAWQSGLIRFMCHSPFSHCDVMIPDPKPHGLLGASDPGGVMVRTHNYQEFKTWHRATLMTDKADRFIDLMHSQIGKPFDDKAMKAVLDDTPREWREPSGWFCSELVCWGLEQSGFFKRPIIVPKNRITPADLLLLLNEHIDADEFYKEWAGVPETLTTDGGLDARDR